MNQTDIANIRLINQQIAVTKASTVKDVVAWMGAMQAQDYAMAKWAVGVRLPGSTDWDVEAAIDNGEIIRPHLLRPTWHLVSADDVYWMLELTAPFIKASMKSREKELELSAAIFAKSNSIIEETLRGRQNVTREELIAELDKHGIATDQNRASHLLVRAELEGIACSGATRGGKLTYALLEARVSKTKPFARDEALAALARRYFASRCPATLQDFAWWSGLSVGDATRALEMIKADFSSETVDSQVYWLADNRSISNSGKASVHLLPAFDEFIISYRDRSAVLPFEDRLKAVSSGGVFRPTIVINGQVTGIWKRTIKKDRVLVETELFRQPEDLTRSLIEKAAAEFARFLGKQIKVSHKL